MRAYDDAPRDDEQKPVLRLAVYDYNIIIYINIYYYCCIYDASRRSSPKRYNIYFRYYKTYTDEREVTATVCAGFRRGIFKTKVSLLRCYLQPSARDYLT